MRRLSFFISDDLDSGLKALKEQYGTPEAETIRRALAVYLTEKGVLKVGVTKTAHKRKTRT
jgi:hypothetical protein